MPTLDHAPEDPSLSYWRDRMRAVRVDAYTTATFLYGRDSAERLFELLDEFDIEHSPDQERREEKWE